MAFCALHRLTLFAVLLLAVCYIHSTEQATIPPRSDEEHSFSVESNETSSPDYDETTSDHSDQLIQKREIDEMGTNSMTPRLSIPGLPDPAAILKIIEVLRTVSEQVLPVIVQGINTPVEIVTEIVNRDFKVLKKLKNRLDFFGQRE